MKTRIRLAALAVLVAYGGLLALAYAIGRGAAPQPLPAARSAHLAFIKTDPRGCKVYRSTDSGMQMTFCPREVINP